MKTIVQRMASTTAARRMFADAKERARQLTMDDPERSFFYGVETAALHCLHPAAKAVWVEDTRWLDADTPQFRDGYLKAMAAMAIAETAPNPPMRVPLPEP